MLYIHQIITKKDHASIIFRHIPRRALLSNEKGYPAKWIGNKELCQKVQIFPIGPKNHKIKPRCTKKITSPKIYQKKKIQHSQRKTLPMPKKDQIFPIEPKNHKIKPIRTKKTYVSATCMCVQYKFNVESYILVNKPILWYHFYMYISRR